MPANERDDAQPGPARTVVVAGSGSAGCVVASRLSEQKSLRVILLESGPDRSATDPTGVMNSVNFAKVIELESAFDAGLMATRLRHDAPRMYHRGRGLGGSASVNAMLALPGIPADYDAWAGVGVEGWSWEDVSPTFDRLRDDLTRSSEEEITPLDAALMRAADHFGLPAGVDTYTSQDGSGILWRTADDGGRRSSWEIYLKPALGRSNLTIRTGAHVERVELRDGRATGVVLVGGERVAADEVVLCAGAIETPAILLRSAIDRAGIGRNLQDHPAASFFLKLKDSVPAPDPSRPCIGVVLRLPADGNQGVLQVLPLHGKLGDSNPQHDGLLLAAVMSVTSTGTVELNPDDPVGPPVISENMLATERDQDLMATAMNVLRRTLATPSFAELVEEVYIDRVGTPLTALDDRGALEEWYNHAIGDYWHAVGTARMGRCDDPLAVVDSAGRVHGTAQLTVIDASVIPVLPRANTHLPVVMVAERLARQLLERLDTPPLRGIR